MKYFAVLMKLRLVTKTDQKTNHTSAFRAVDV